MTITIPPLLTLKNVLSVVVGGILALEAAVPLIVDPTHLRWTRWQVGIPLAAAVGVIAIIGQAILQSREEREQKRQLVEQGKQIQEIYDWAQKASSGAIVPAKTELAEAETEAGFVAPNATTTAQISAKLLHGHLIQRHPLAGITDDFLRAAGHEFHDTVCDFLLEIFLVNKGNAQTTIQEIVGEAHLGEEWVPLKLVEELSDYQFEFNEETVDNPQWVGGGKSPRVEDLTPNLAKVLRTAVLTHAVGYRGWLRFGMEVNTKYLAAPIPYRVNLIDALDVSHPVLTTDPLLTDGHIIHSPKVWRERLRSS